MGPVEKVHRRVMRPDLFLKGIPFSLLVRTVGSKVEAEVPAGRYWEKSFQVDFEGRATRFVPGWDAE